VKGHRPGLKGGRPSTITALAGGALDVGSTNRSITVNDSVATDDLVINNVAINGSGGVTKAGPGTLALNGATVAGPLTVNAGTLQSGTFSQLGNFTASSLSLNAGTTLKMKIGATADQINVTGLNGLAASGTTLRITSLNGPLGVGTTDLINYSGAIQGGGLAGFTLVGAGHATATLQDTGTAVRLNVTQVTDPVIWTGATNTTWDNSVANVNWKFQTSGTGTGFLDGDDVVFQDLAVPAPTTVNVASVVTPSRLVVNNTTANSFTFTGAGISGPTGLTKNGNGTLLLANANNFTGATALNAGTLELDTDTGTLNDTANVGTSGVTVAAGATLKLTKDDGNFTFNRNISGAGTVVIDPHTLAGSITPREVTISGTNTGFTGLLKLSPSNLGTGGGSFRTLNTSTNATALGSAVIDVDAGAQLWIANDTTLNNNITITGTGYMETGGGTPVGLGTLTNGVYVGAGTPLFGYAGIGAIRMGTNDTLTGNLVVDGNSKIMAFGQTGTISGNISSTSATDTLVVGGGTSGTTMIFTGTNTYGKTMVNGGSGTSSVTQLLQIGNNGNTGTLGTGEVVLYGNSAASAELRFNRADGYTLAPGQNILGAAGATADLARTKVIVNTTGTGLTLNGNTIDLSDGTTGGELRVAGNNGSNGVNGSILNITGSSVVDTGLFYIGDQANMSGTVNQSGTSSVTVLGQVRIGHFSTETSNYNMSGGSLTLAGTPTQLCRKLPRRARSDRHRHKHHGKCDRHESAQLDWISRRSLGFGYHRQHQLERWCGC
jgi:autotransporter-associated beta strand protein